MGDSRFERSVFIVAILLLLLRTEGISVGITYVETAVAKGAICLDGSPPAYHFDKGSSDGINNWLIHFEGGGWCNNVTTCLARRDTRFGSSKQMANETVFSGILSGEQQFNPDFYNWNRIKVRYCDGASYTGDVEVVDPATNLHFRGAKVFAAVVRDILAKGMNDAQNAIVSGSSAGGLTAILNCDKFRSLVPPAAKVKCVADAGFFINAKDVSGCRHILDFYSEVVTTHGSAKNLPTSCTSRMNPGSCFFPQNAAQRIQTPVFILNAAYDTWQVKNILAPEVADPHGLWHDCKSDIKSCSIEQLKILQDFRMEFVNAINQLEISSSRGMFIDSCYAHGQSERQDMWLSINSPVLANTSIAEAVGDWYYGRNDFRVIDCPYPCNPTCHNRIYESQPHDSKAHPGFTFED